MDGTRPLAQGPKDTVLSCPAALLPCPAAQPRQSKAKQMRPQRVCVVRLSDSGSG